VKFLSILWKNIQNYNTLIAFLPNESIEILYKNEIIISISKSPLFNYVAFIKSISTEKIFKEILNILQPLISQNLDDDNIVAVIQEIFKNVNEPNPIFFF